MFSPKRKYFDYAATTPIHKDVANEVNRIFQLRQEGKIGNPLSFHSEGVFANSLLEDARKRIANILKVQSKEIIFTGNATEANSIAIFGTVEMHKKMGKRYEDMHIITTDIEHIAVQKAMSKLKKLGVKVSYLEAGENGRVDAKKITSLINENTILVTVIYIQSETGVIQPVSEIGNILKSLDRKIVFHTDACQAIKYFSVDPHSLGIDLMTLDSLKVYGPAGVGMLYKSLSVDLEPITFGAKQENGIRAGTQNVEGIVGFAKAVEIAEQGKEKEHKRIEKLTSDFISKLREKVPDLMIHGEGAKRSPNYAFIYIPNVDSEYLAARLDIKGFATSTGSACNEGVAISLKEMYKNSPKKPTEGIRVTFGNLTNSDDIEEVAEVIIKESKFLLEKAFCDTIKT